MLELCVAMIPCSRRWFGEGADYFVQNFIPGSKVEVVLKNIDRYLKRIIKGLIEIFFLQINRVKNLFGSIMLLLYAV